LVDGICTVLWAEESRGCMNDHQRPTGTVYTLRLSGSWVEERRVETRELERNEREERRVETRELVRNERSVNRRSRSCTIVPTKFRWHVDV
jgi:hypothetical protein